MAKQTYIYKDIREEIYKNFKKTYRKMLIDDVFGNEEMADQVLSNRKAARMFDRVVELSFKDEPCEEYLREYEKCTEDKCLKNYIEVYKAFIDETSHALYDSNGNFMNSWLNAYFQDINAVINKVYKSLKVDCENNFHWWRKTDATALRRQLHANILFFSRKKMNALCKKYLKQDYDFNRIDDKKYNTSLMAKLDRIMEQNGNRKVYTYPGKDIDGNTIICESETQPKVPYYIIAYKSKESEVFQDKGAGKGK